VRILGLDYGDRNIGVAVSDSLGWTAQGKGVIRETDLHVILAEIKEYIKKYDIQEIVIGLPFNMDGSRGPRAEKTQAFINFLKNNLDLPMHSWDERLTTKQAENVLLSADMSRAKRKKVIDKMAAALILQSYLDAKS